MGGLRAIREAAEAVKVRIAEDLRGSKGLEVLRRRGGRDRRVVRACRSRKATGNIILETMAC